METSIRGTSKVSALHEIKEVWNQLTEKYRNPFLTFDFFKRYIDLNRSKGWASLTLLISVNNSLVGIVPLITRKRFGIRYARFVTEPAFSPRFILQEQHREVCLEKILDFIFGTLRCHYLELTFTAQSIDMVVLMHECLKRVDTLRSFISPTNGHSILAVDRSWHEFESYRGRNFKHKFRKIERKLNHAGSWMVTCTENTNDPNILERVLDVERRSWKERFRTQRGLRSDPSIKALWEASQSFGKTTPDFQWKIWFLELNGQTVSYCFFIQHNEVAFDCKTSYDQRYKEFYPGIFVNNAAIRDIFERREVKHIDFLTDLPFHHTWTSTTLPRERIIIVRKGVFSTLIHLYKLVPRHLYKLVPRLIQDKLFLG